ncbi:MAG: glycosyltransferase family 4 protein [Vulcanisaeta sp. AZ3]
MKLGIVSYIPLRIGGGGDIHALNVIKGIARVAEDFEITLFPSTNTLSYIKSNEDKESLLKNLDEFSKLGIKTANGFTEILNNYKPMPLIKWRYQTLTFNLTKELTRHYIKTNSQEMYDFMYDPNLASPDVMMLSKLSNGKYGFHITSDYPLSITWFWKLMRTAESLSLYALRRPAKLFIQKLISKTQLRFFMRIYGKPRFVDFVSEGDARLAGADKWGVPYYVFRPANAIDPVLLSYRGVGKGDYLVFYARLVPDKGIYELPKIIKVIKDEYDKNIKLKVMGRFGFHGYKQLFFNLIKKYNVEDNIEYLGFRSGKELYDIVARAKIFIYPTHFDSFSIAILESLALGTPVIAYDIPGPYMVFNGLPGIEFVREFDYKAMARAAIRILKNYDEYLGQLIDERLIDFVRQHSSWDLVAKQVVELIRKHSR